MTIIDRPDRDWYTGVVKSQLAQVSIGDEFWLRNGVGVSSTFDNFSSLINVILPNVYVLASLLLFLLLIGGGIMVIVNAGSDNPEGTAKGRKAVSAALIGFLIVFGSYWIIQLIDLITGLDILHGGGL